MHLDHTLRRLFTFQFCSPVHLFRFTFAILQVRFLFPMQCLLFFGGHRFFQLYIVSLLAQLPQADNFDRPGRLCDWTWFLDLIWCCCVACVVFFFSPLCFCSKKLKLVATRCFENGAMSGITLSMKKNAGHFWKMLSYMNCVNMKKQTKKVKQRKQGERTTQQRFKLVK